MVSEILFLEQVGIRLDRTGGSSAEKEGIQCCGGMFPLKATSCVPGSSSARTGLGQLRGWDSSVPRWGGASGERGQPRSPGPRGTSQRRRSKGAGGPRVWRGLTRVRQRAAATLPLPPCPLPPRPVPFPLSRAVEDGTWLGVLPGVQCHAGRMHSPPRACSVILRHKDSSLLLMSGSVTGSWNSARDKGFRW